VCALVMIGDAEGLPCFWGEGAGMRGAKGGLCVPKGAKGCQRVPKGAKLTDVSGGGEKWRT
jgi:hypothetical protein